jgi:hypothetical protein
MEAKSLPALRLDQPSTKLFVAEVGKAMPVREIASLATLPIADQRRAISARLSSLPPTITREECDKCLGDLALVVPSSNVGDEDGERMLDLHFGIYKLNGVTRDMLRFACMVFAAAPTKGKPKWFPDPGTLLEIVADQARARKRDIAALRRGLDVLDGKIKPEPEPDYPSADILAERREKCRAVFTRPGPERRPLKPIPEGCTPPPIKPAGEQAAALDAAMQRHRGAKP